MLPNKEKYNNQQTQELIDAYLMDKLEGGALADFEKEIELSTKLHTLVNDQKFLKLAVEEENLRNSLDSFHNEIPQKRKKKRYPMGWLALAASVLILIGVSTWAIFYTGTSAQKVYAENFRPDPGLPTIMGTASQYEFYDGMVSYKRKDYTEAISRWEPLYAANPKNDTLVYFLGVANLANGNVRQAENYLKMAKEKTESVFYEDIQYYLALAYLKENKIKEAKDVLSQSTSSAGIELLNQVNNL